MGIELTSREVEALEMFYKNRCNLLKYYSNNLALEGNLVETLELTKKGFVKTTTDEKTNTAYFVISKKGLDYVNTIRD